MINATINGNLTSNSSESFLDCLEYDPYNPICDDVYRYKPFKLTAGKALSAFGMAILILTALAGNVLVCAAFCYYRRLRTVTNYFIVSLAISDIMVAAFSMPLWLSLEVSGWEKLPKWIDFNTLVTVWEIYDIFVGVSSIANLTAISLDRFFSIMAPLRHRTRMTPFVAMILISFCWVYALVIALCRLVHNNTYILLSSTFGFFLPLAIILFCYISIYIKFRMRSSRQGNFEGDWNLEKTLLIVIGLFFVCWIPFHICSILYVYCASCEFEQLAIIHLTGFVKWMHYLNSCCNPLVYGFFNINFKTAFWAMLHRCLGNPYSDIDLVGLSRENSNSQNGSFLRHLKSLRRKLSWKRDVEESIVSNGELNENSISMAMLALHLKSSGQDAEYQEGTSLLLGNSNSRSSSKLSDALGVGSDDQSSLFESPNGKASTDELISHSESFQILTSKDVAANAEQNCDLVFEEPAADAIGKETLELNDNEAAEPDHESDDFFCNVKRVRKVATMPDILAFRNGLELSNEIELENEKSINEKSPDTEETRCLIESPAESCNGNGNGIRRTAYSFSSAIYMIKEAEVKDGKQTTERMKGKQFLDSKESNV